MAPGPCSPVSIAPITPAPNGPSHYECMFCHNGIRKSQVRNEEPGAEAGLSTAIAQRHRLSALPRTRPAAHRRSRQTRRDPRRDPRLHRQPQAPHAGPRDGSLHAMPPRNFQPETRRTLSNARTNALLIHPRSATRKFRADLRSANPAKTRASKSLTPRTPFANRSASCRRNRKMPATECAAPPAMTRTTYLAAPRQPRTTTTSAAPATPLSSQQSSRRTAPREPRLRELPHAETPHRRRRAHRHDRPFHPAPSFRRQSLAAKPNTTSPTRKRIRAK